MDGELSLAAVKLVLAAEADGRKQAEAVEPASHEACVKPVFVCN